MLFSQTVPWINLLEDLFFDFAVLFFHFLLNDLYSSFNWGSIILFFIFRMTFVWLHEVIYTGHFFIFLLCFILIFGFEGFRLGWDVTRNGFRFEIFAVQQGLLLYSILSSLNKLQLHYWTSAHFLHAIFLVFRIGANGSFERGDVTVTTVVEQAGVLLGLGAWKLFRHIWHLRFCHASWSWFDIHGWLIWFILAWKEAFLPVDWGSSWLKSSPQFIKLLDLKISDHLFPVGGFILVVNWILFNASAIVQEIRDIDMIIQLGNMGVEFSQMVIWNFRAPKSVHLFISHGSKVKVQRFLGRWLALCRYTGRHVRKGLVLGLCLRILINPVGALLFLKIERLSAIVFPVLIDQTLIGHR